MELTFANEEIRSICEAIDVAERKFGEDAAFRLRTRLADLRASTNLCDLPSGNLRQQNATSSEAYMIDVTPNIAVKFEINQRNKYYLSDNGVDLTKVYRIRLTFIGGEDD